MAKEKIAAACQNSGIYTVMMDGMEDKNGVKMEAVVLRY